MNHDRPRSVRIEHICDSPFFLGVWPVPNPDDFQDAQPWGRVMHLAQASTENCRIVHFTPCFRTFTEESVRAEEIRIAYSA